MKQASSRDCRLTGRPRTARAPGNARKSMLVLCATLLTTACASTDGGGGEPIGKRTACFWERSVYDFKSLDDRNVLVWTNGRRKAYKVSVGGGCFDLDHAHQIGFVTRDGRVCGFGGAELIIPRGRGERCSIQAVRELNALELAEIVPPRGTPVDVKSTLILPADEAEHEHHRPGPTETWGTTTNVTPYGPLYIAGMPDAAALDTAVERGVATVINLRAPGETEWDVGAAAAERNLTYHNVPIPGDSDTFDAAAIDRITALVQQHADQPILLHCSSGNRASAWLAIHGVRDGGMELEDALALARQTGLTKEALADRIRNFLAE